MAALFLEEKVEVRSDKGMSADQQALKPAPPLVREDEIAVELGIWLSGLESFLGAGHNSFAGVLERRELPDLRKEFRLIHSAIQRCALLNVQLLNTRGRRSTGESEIGDHVEIGELSQLLAVLRDALLFSQGLINSNSLSFGEWKVWCNFLSQRFAGVPIFLELVRFAEESGEKFLPTPLKNLVERSDLSSGHTELVLILPRFAKILKWLSVVGKMLEADEPLKPAILIFSRVNEQIIELTNYINNRLERFPNDNAEIFASLDAAAYTASIELKKVYAQELTGLARLRPSPSIFARMETAHSLLSDGFQQILAGFAKLIDPDTDIFKLFPNFQVKFEQSLRLRNSLWTVSRIVKVAENKPESRQIKDLRETLREFMKETVYFLFYKDTETVERFIEEILVTEQTKDLVPILHRFGAYVDTLFNQVNLRAVLENHPFEAEEI